MLHSYSLSIINLVLRWSRFGTVRRNYYWEKRNICKPLCHFACMSWHYLLSFSLRALLPCTQMVCSGRVECGLRIGRARAVAALVSW